MMKLLLPLNSFWLSGSRWPNTKFWSETDSTADMTKDMTEGFVIPSVWELFHQRTSENWRSGELRGCVSDTSMHELVDWRSQFGSPLFFFLITPSHFKWPQIQFFIQQVLNVIQKCTRVGRNCSKICFEVAKETICLLSYRFSVAL